MARPSIGFAVARHVGDLGNIKEEAGGVITSEISDSIISLDDTSDNYIVGRAIVVSISFSCGLQIHPIECGIVNVAAARFISSQLM